jgi:amino-acid N-acetyltransferase
LLLTQVFSGLTGIFQNRRETAEASTHMSDNHQHVKWFRDSSPYINAHRGKTFVLYLGGESLLHENFTNIVADIVLLNSLGVRLVVVHGARPQIDEQLAKTGAKAKTIEGVRITTPAILTLVQQVVGKIRIDIEAALSRGVVNAPLYGTDITVSSGNYIKAKPLGISEGVDFHNTGSVRKVNAELIHKHLDDGAIVIVSPLGFSPSGEVFNINSAEVAGSVASAILADKLILLTADRGVFDLDKNLLNEIPVNDINEDDLQPCELLGVARQACLKGVERCHLISFVQDGALLEELFTRDGAGTQICRISYEQIRTANAEDVGGIIELIQPLEEQGILVRRSRELLESEISQFTVIERDGMIVSCAALYPFGQQGELACLATHETYRNSNRGQTLLNHIEQVARKLKLTSIFVLTTNTAHWFTERGFAEASKADLPESRQSLYNYQRNSKLFVKSLV